MTSEREEELEHRVEELEQNSSFGWSAFLFGLPGAVLFEVLNGRSRKRARQARLDTRQRFEAWKEDLDDATRTELDGVLEQGLPLPDGATGDYALGFRAHAELLRGVDRDEVLHHVARTDDAQELLHGNGLETEALSVEWLRGFQSANAALAKRFGAPMD